MEKNNNTEFPPEIQALIDNARNEIKKVVDDRKQKMSNEEKRNALDQSIGFADNVLKKLIAYTVNRPVESLFDMVTEQKGDILLEIKNKKSVSKKFIMSLDIVSKDYILDPLQLGESEINNGAGFLFSTIDVLYPALNKHMAQWAKKNNTAFNYTLQRDGITVYLDDQINKRIGVVVRSV
jgi:hypothetical protein